MLKLQNVDVFYGKVQALSDVCINVEQGQIVALVGSNGAGKSTTLKTISGLLKPSRGSVEYKGQHIAGLAPDMIVKLGIGHCPEERHVWPQMTVWENLMMGAYSRNDKDGIERDLQTNYEIFPKLLARKTQKAGSLSGGEQQMLAIGRTLMIRPDLVMFDEPSLGLSPLFVEHTAQIIRDINKNGRTILLVEQNAQMALKMAHKAYVLESGRIVLEGTGEELLFNPYVKKAYLGI
ncbi:MAG: ABC transporter ATP-binding protein [Anaerolineaceae bacterium]|nr:ABC transporter ATP-binding protein [Anaerolineaceae bacterium]